MKSTFFQSKGLSIDMHSHTLACSTKNLLKHGKKTDLQCVVLEIILLNPRSLTMEMSLKPMKWSHLNF